MMLSGIVLIWLITALELWLVTLIVPGIRARSPAGLLWATLVSGFVNAFIRPVLWMLTLPLTVLTFGLFALVINAFTLWLTAELVEDFEIDSFGSALLGALVMALLGAAGFALLHWLLMGEVRWIIYRAGTGISI